MMDKVNRRRPWSFIPLFICILMIGALTVNAQGTATPISVGQNVSGQLTDPEGTIQYSVSVAAPQSINVQVLAITSGFAPTFRILDPSNIVVLDTANPGTQTIAQGIPSLSSPGTYIIEIKSANNAPGQFLLSVQPGAPLAPPTPLTLGQPVNGSLTAQDTRAAYSFSASSTDVLLLNVDSTVPEAGQTITLRNADTGETLAMTSAALGGARFRILDGQTNYLLEVTGSGTGTNAPGTFAVCLETASGTVACPPAGAAEGGIAPTAAPTIAPPVQTVEVASVPTLVPTLIPTVAGVVIDPNGACEVTPAKPVSVNVRSGPGTGYGIISTLFPNSAAPVIGRLPDNSWFQVNNNGSLGWVSGSVVTLGGTCAGVTVVILPTAVPPTNAPTNMPTTMPTAADTGAPTATPTTAFTPVPTITGTHTLHINPIIGRITLVAPIQIVPVNPKLDYQASANYGEANLSAGFSPDPYSVGMTTGGAVNVSYLGSSCSGFATSHPDLRINFGGGGASLLRIYFVGSNGDPAMVVNDPYGNFYCVDNSFGTVNPTIDFNNPAGGTYDVWIASHAANTTISGTLYLTENSGNHP